MFYILMPDPHAGLGKYLRIAMERDGVREEDIKMFNSCGNLSDIEEFREEMSKIKPSRGTIVMVSQSILKAGELTNEIARELFDRGFVVARYYECEREERDQSRRWAAAWDWVDVSIHTVAENLIQLRREDRRKPPLEVKR